ncbi:MAG: GTP 3',8-cyclase MoaA [Planctomycetes bacterium]|nr:GTP 3',8-cyclase MoaA [Planctomycetota bacterium]
MTSTTGHRPPDDARAGDRFGRPLRSLRLSVTDRCNLRCSYCMPEEEYVWLPREDVLHFEELVRLTAIATRLGVTRVRITGGEPLMRRELEVLVARLARDVPLADLSLTTNGVVLARHAEALRRAGLKRITVSLDSLRPETFRATSGRDALANVLAGIDAARAAGFRGIKLNTVVLRGRNDGELEALVDYAATIDGEVRFIEYMDVGGATRWQTDQVVSRAEILARFRARFGAVEPIVDDTWAPADRFKLPDGRVFGVISSTTEPFCATCDRARITADGVFFTCLYARHGLQLRDAMRNGASDDELAGLLGRVWSGRQDRGAEERLALRASRGALAAQDELRTNPHLEMHTRGG